MFQVNATKVEKEGCLEPELVASTIEADLSGGSLTGWQEYLEFPA